MIKLKIKKITKLDTKKKVYDLSIDETHNFFIGNHQEILTSNCDGTTIDGQRALRNTMEEYSSNTRFILTANYKHKIIPAIQSRTQLFDLTPPFDDVLKRVISIIKQENIKVPDNQKSNLINVIKQNYPDVRKIINSLQRSTINKTFNVDIALDNNSIIEFIHKNIQSKNTLALRKYLIENESEFQGDYHNLMKRYLNFVYESELPSDKKRQYILILSQYMLNDVWVLDKEINAFACWVKLEEI